MRIKRRIVNIEKNPIAELPFLNAGRGAGGFYEDRLPVLVCTVDRLPQGLDAIVVTDDLQGREHFKFQSGPSVRLLGEWLPRVLRDSILPQINRDIDVGLRHIDGEHIFVSVSRDGGKTWGQPTILSEQPLGSNRDDDYLTALPSVAVNREGVVAVTWYDRRGLPKFDARQRVNDWNVRARISVDGGASWLPSVQLNQVLSKGEFDVGHTAGLTASSDGRFHALWIDARDGTRQLRTTSFRVE